MIYCNDILKSIQATQEKRPAFFELEHLGCIYIYGKDASSFLQGQLTCDVNALSALKAQPTLCCNLQGRIVALFFIMIWQEGYLLILPKNILSSTLKHFKKYAVFSKITFDLNTVQTLMGFSEQAPENAYSCLNNLFLLPNYIPTETTLKHEAWHYQQMIQGFPDIAPNTQDKFLPLRLQLDKIEGAISFNKGCYLGQEIIARMHFKATQKHSVFLCETSAQFVPGDILLDKTGEENIGEIIDIADLSDANTIKYQFLAAIKTDAIEKITPSIKIIRNSL